MVKNPLNKEQFESIAGAGWSKVCDTCSHVRTFETVKIISDINDKVGAWYNCLCGTTGIIRHGSNQGGE